MRTEASNVSLTAIELEILLATVVKREVNARPGRAGGGDPADWVRDQIAGQSAVSVRLEHDPLICKPEVPVQGVESDARGRAPQMGRADTLKDALIRVQIVRKRL